MKQTIVTALFALPFAAFAGTIIDGKDPAPPTPALTPSAIGGDIGITVLNQYDSRGLILENKGVACQPYGDLYLKLHDGYGFMNSFSLQAGVWGDVNPAGPIAGHDANNKAWTEFFWQTGVIVKFAERFSLSSVYRQYTSPSVAYLFGRSINSIVSFDDSGQLGKNISLQPNLTVLYELPAPGHNGLRGHSWYFAPGVAPNYTIFTGSKMPVKLSLPVSAGLGSSFYAGDTFGYFSAGPQVTVLLTFVPTQYGMWIFSAGYSYTRLGSTNEAFAQDHRFSQHSFNASIELRF